LLLVVIMLRTGWGSFFSATIAPYIFGALRLGK
jgi:hypothetical protein